MCVMSAPFTIAAICVGAVMLILLLLHGCRRLDERVLGPQRHAMGPPAERRSAMPAISVESAAELLGHSPATLARAGAVVEVDGRPVVPLAELRRLGHRPATRTFAHPRHRLS